MKFTSAEQLRAELAKRAGKVRKPKKPVPLVQKSVAADRRSAVWPMRVICEANARDGHHMAKARRVKSQREEVAWRALELRKPTLPCRIVMTRLSPRQLDSDGLVSAFKAVRDELARWLGVNDGSDAVEWACRWERSREYGVRVEVVEVVEVANVD